jgi:pyridoxine kinase
MECCVKYPYNSNMENTKILAISSLPAHKTAGLKAMISILGSSILPVPSVVLSGVNSFAEIVKQKIEIKPLIESSLQIALNESHNIYLFVGYLLDYKDILIVKDFIIKNKHHFAGIIVDPISGDNDKPYISQTLINEWPELLRYADMAFPNITELKIYSGLKSMDDHISNHLSAFEARYPDLKYIVTSYIDDNIKGVLFKEYNSRTIIRHRYFKAHIDGSGDVFASYFIKYYYIEKKDFLQSCRKATDSTLRLVKKSINNKLVEMSI